MSNAFNAIAKSAIEYIVLLRHIFLAMAITFGLLAFARAALGMPLVGLIDALFAFAHYKLYVLGASKKPNA
jgi:uncharacterized membrane protein